MYHAMAQAIYIAGAMKRGIRVYIMKKFDFVQWLEAIQKYRITGLSMVPPLVVVSSKFLPARCSELMITFSGYCQITTYQEL
jgi:hypothetical protein